MLMIKGENCDGTDFKMEDAATLPELSEWTLLALLENCGQPRKRKVLK